MHAIRQLAGIGVAGEHRRAFCLEAVFVAVAEQQLAEREQVGVVAVGCRARLARHLPVKTWLRNAVGESERFLVAHVAGFQNLDHGQASLFCLRIFRHGHRFSMLVIGCKQDQQDMRFVVFKTPIPLFRSIGADIAQPQRAVGAARHALGEFGREFFHHVFAHAESAQARCGECDLNDFRLLEELQVDNGIGFGRSVAVSALSESNALQAIAWISAMSTSDRIAGFALISRPPSGEFHRRSLPPSRRRCGCGCCGQGPARSIPDRPCTRRRSESDDGAGSA